MKTSDIPGIIKGWRDARATCGNGVVHVKQGKVDEWRISAALVPVSPGGLRAAMKAKPGDETIPFEAFAYCTMQVTRLAREYDMRKFHGK